VRTYSFVITVIIIAVFIAGSYYQSLPTVEHIPANFVFKVQDWMAFVPSDAEYVGYVNYQQAYAVSGNASLFGKEILLEFPQSSFQAIPSDIVYEVAIQLPEPQYSGSALVLQLASGKQTGLSSQLASANLKNRTFAGYRIYELLTREFGDKSLTLGYVAIVNGHLVFSNDQNTALQNVEAILDQVSGRGNGLFDQVSIKRAVYASGVTDQDYVGLFVGRFPTQLNDTQMAVKSVLGSGDSLSVTRALLFPSSNIALQRLDQAHEVYKNASSYRILDSWMVVTYNYPLSRLRAELIGI
jgi:hypothetical protein